MRISDSKYYCVIVCVAWWHNHYHIRFVANYKLTVLFEMRLLYDRVGLNSMNLVGRICDLVQKLLMVYMQEQV